MIGITKDLETKDEILDVIKSISKNMQDNDVWRWEIIKILVRQREGHLTAEIARRGILNLAHYMPELFLVKEYIDEFESKYEIENQSQPVQLELDFGDKGEGQ
jgi:hypothetical protein